MTATPRRTRKLTICSGLPLAEGVPDRVLFIPWGDFETTRGKFQLAAADADDVLEDFKWRGNDVVIDYEHATLKEFRPSNGQAPAAGWTKQLKVEPNVGVFADVEWTEQAKRAIAAREYRYLSPVVVHDEDGRVFGLHSVALTNHPAINHFPAILSDDDETSAGVGGPNPSMEQNMPTKKIVTALSLTDGSDETACVKAIETMSTELKTLKAAPKVPALICKATGLTDSATAEDVVAAVEKIKKADPDPARFVAMSDFVALREEVKANKAKQTATEADAFVKHGLATGQIKKGKEDAWKAKYTANSADAESSLALIPAGTFPADGEVVHASANGGAAAGAGGRAGIITAACSEFDANIDRLGMATSKRAFINGELMQGKHKALSDEEAGKIGA